MHPCPRRCLTINTKFAQPARNLRKWNRRNREGNSKYLSHQQGPAGPTMVQQHKEIENEKYFDFWYLWITSHPPWTSKAWLSRFQFSKLFKSVGHETIFNNRIIWLSILDRVSRDLAGCSWGLMMDKTADRGQSGHNTRPLEMSIVDKKL